MYFHKDRDRNKSYYKQEHQHTHNENNHAVNEMLLALAQEQRELAHLVHAEVDKIYHVIKYHENLNDLLNVNNSVKDMLKMITIKEQVIYRIIKILTLLSAEDCSTK